MSPSPNPPPKLRNGKQRNFVNLDKRAMETFQTQSACLRASLVVMVNKFTIPHTMKTLVCIIITYVIFVPVAFSQSEFYQFPYNGWRQYILHTEAPPSGWFERIDTVKFQQDTIIDTLNYIHLTWGSGNYYVRYDSGMVFQRILNSGQMEDKLLYDFTLNVGDTLHDYYYPSSNTNYIVTIKEKRLVHQDSLWYMELYLDQWTNLAWLEGVGELERGFIPKFGIEESNNHICTQNSINQTIAENEDLFSSGGYDCDFIHGFDLDEDGFRTDFDCDDGNSEIYPEAEEIPNNDIDEDCNGEDLVVLIPCQAFAGSDTAICLLSFGTDTLYLGDQPVVTGGQAPFQYRWTTFYQHDVLEWHASDFLSDTAVANPAIVNPFDHPLTFHLEVTDSEGTTCSDSVRVDFSQYTWTLDVKERAILQGDSVQLYISIYGGIAPLSYHWSPETGLTDPTNPFTWASPDTTTMYELTVTDSAGCVGADNFRVIVMPTIVNETSAESMMITLQPNPLHSESLLKVSSPVIVANEVYIYNSFGQFIQSYNLVNNEVVLQGRDYSPGLYYYQVRGGGSMVGTGKMVVTIEVN